MDAVLNSYLFCWHKIRVPGKGSKVQIVRWAKRIVESCFYRVGAVWCNNCGQHFLVQRLAEYLGQLMIIDWLAP